MPISITYQHVETRDILFTQVDATIVPRIGDRVAIPDPDGSETYYTIDSVIWKPPAAGDADVTVRLRFKAKPSDLD